MSNTFAVIVVIIAGLINVGSALAVVWFGHRFQLEREDRRWRFDRRLDAYSAFLAAADAEWLDQITDGMPRSALSRDEHIARMTRLLEFSHVRGRIMLLGDQEVVSAAETVGVRLDASRMVAMAASDAGQTYEPYLGDDADIDEFLSAARKELGLPPLERTTRAGS